jgi:peptidylprolyl isomerase
MAIAAKMAISATKKNEMVNAVPALVLPGQFPTLEPQVQRHDESDVGDQRQQADPGPVTYRPDPAPEKGTPRPPFDTFWWYDSTPAAGIVFSTGEHIGNLGFRWAVWIVHNAPFGYFMFANNMRSSALLIVLALVGGRAVSAPATYRSPADILAAAPTSHWRKPDPANLLYLELLTGRVIIELAPQFAAEHVANIRLLARGGFWNNSSIYRVQDNFVAQLGDADAEDANKARSLGDAKRHLPAEFHRAAAGLTFDQIPDRDGWAPEVGFVDGFPVARDPKSGKAWVTHCYGTVGAGRDNAEDSSTGAELYVVIGQSPRQLDDNITVVGRVLQGMELLSSLRRGPPPMGFYASPSERAPIRSLKLASDVPPAERTPIEVLKTDTQTFRDVVEARRNRVDAFYKRPAGHIDLCNISVPVR